MFPHGIPWLSVSTRPQAVHLLSLGMTFREHSLRVVAAHVEPHGVTWIWSQKGEDVGVTYTFNWVVISIIFYVHPYLGKWSGLTHIFTNGLVQPPTSYMYRVLDTHTILAIYMLHIHVYIYIYIYIQELLCQKSWDVVDMLCLQLYLKWTSHSGNLVGQYGRWSPWLSPNKRASWPIWSEKNVQ